MRTQFQFIAWISLFLIDLALVNACFAGSAYFIKPFWDTSHLQIFFHRAVTYNLMWQAWAGMFGLYERQSLRELDHLYRATWRAVVMQMIGMTVYFYLLDDTEYTKYFLTTLFATLCFVMAFSRFILTVLDVLYRRRFNAPPSVAVLGFNPTGIKLAEYFARHSRDFKFEGILDEGHSMFVDEYGELQNHMIDGIRKAARSQIRELYVSLPPAALLHARQLLVEAEAQCIRLRVVPDYSGAMAARFKVSYLDDFPLFSLRPEPLEDMKARFKKRLFDTVFSLLVIVCLLSWLYPIIAIIIKIQSPGPVLFKQLRSGRDNKPFWCYKFRSMKVNDESDKRQATKNDDRITPIGKFMRKTSLDELPQFFNVLKGEMSVVGPRPHMLAHTEQYRAIIDTFMVRHFLKPGITGWAQVRGCRGETRDPAEMEARVEHDIYYLEHWNLMFDVRIIFLTIYLTLKGDEKAF